MWKSPPDVWKSPHVLKQWGSHYVKKYFFVPLFELAALLKYEVNLANNYLERQLFFEGSSAVSHLKTRMGSVIRPKRALTPTRGSAHHDCAAGGIAVPPATCHNAQVRTARHDRFPRYHESARLLPERLWLFTNQWELSHAYSAPHAPAKVIGASFLLQSRSPNPFLTDCCYQSTFPRLVDVHGKSTKSRKAPVDNAGQDCAC